ncbi:helix-turn-helix domain-containing protein [Oscillatoriales cyanobacterium LEGE 11467]|uniref:Helix-turn-helix domain-containing protein n=1 Tax=Zarconia navalis LEGE 11467 TaxID=1828826 RepID=A0A928VTY0_9CYAN|nr:AraC family transcriptional regulator [Zarconia navalis]MBE9040086.1 helix-turn-helix domain-containing protein [Zarconia navalis LEGE 11467]
MDKSELVPVDFKQEASLRQVLEPPRAILSSREIAWKHLHFEYHYHAAHETPEHYPTQHVVAIQTEGQILAERRIDGQLQREQIAAGDVCIVPAYTPHWIYAAGEQGLIFLCIEPEFLKQVAYDAVDSEAIFLRAQFAKPDPFIHQIGLSLKHVLQSDPLGSRFYAQTLSTALAAHLLQHYCDRTSLLKREGDRLDRAKVRVAIEYINDRLTQKLSLAEIADATGISQYHLCRLFKQVTGQSPWQYVIQQRIEIAKQQLKTSKHTIAEISDRLGFSSQGQFSNFFRKHTGISPMTYRRKI